MRLLFSLLATCVSTSVGFAAEKPNFVFLIADDLGWGDVAFHGGNMPTPHLDRLKSEGAELARHYVAPVCSPTRAALMTGRFGSRFGVTSPQNDQALPFETTTIASALKQCGYDTCLSGKWHLGSKPEWGPNHFGFDHSYGSLAGGVGPYDHRYKTGEYSVTWHRNGELIEEEGHVTDLLANEAVKWIGERGEKPFFLYVPFTAVHLPVKEPQAWLDRVPASITGQVPRHYAACIAHLDDAVGRIVRAIDEAGKGADTLIVFTSDNGGSTVENNDAKYASGGYPEGRLPGNNLPWRGQKTDLYEGGIRAATLVRWTGRIRAGVVIDPIAQISDWMPTFCSLAGYEPERDLRWDGIDLSATLTTLASPPPRSIYSVAPGFRARAIQENEWKLIVHGPVPGLDANAKSGVKPRVELFHLGRDPGETVDRSTQEHSRVEEMLEHLIAIARSDRDSVAPKGPK